MANPTPERIEAAVRAAYPNTDFEIFDELQPLRDEYRARIARALAAAAGVAPRRDDLVERIADTLAYYQCRETNPKADDPRMGYHAFSEEQRAHLRERKAEAAAEIVRMFAAAGAAPQEPSRDEYREGYEAWRASGRRMLDALLTVWKMCEPYDTSHMTFGEDPQEVVRSARAALAAPVQVDEAKLAEVIWAEQESRVLNGYVIHTRATAAATAAAVASHLRGGQQ